MTALFSDVIFGPIHSRRLGLSLGVNLLPTDSKLCNFNCIYCECGWNEEHVGRRHFNSREQVAKALEHTLTVMVARSEVPDVITFAGNGEPTLHPDFEAIIDDTIAIRDRVSPSSKISLLSNATQLHREDVRRALQRLDNTILKIDSAFEHTAKLMNQPAAANYSVERVVEQMCSLQGNIIVQTMFLKSTWQGEVIDNTQEHEVQAWLELLERIAPKSVMVYSIDRDTPHKEIEKCSREVLSSIAERVRALGIECSVA